MPRTINPEHYAFPDDSTERGLTKREYLASHIYAALMGRIALSDGLSPRSRDEYARRAVESADSLIQALNEKQSEKTGQSG